MNADFRPTQALKPPPTRTPRLSLALALVLAIGATGCLAQAKPSGKGASKPPASAGCPAILQHTFARLQDDAPQNLCQYAGKVVLVVNTASYCGFTHQYQGLEALYAAYQSRGLVVLGFPSNDFGEQEPGSAKQIADLCFNTYGVQFPMMAKTVVSGPGQNAFYAGLQKATGQTPQWNFHKYLLDRKGKIVGSYPSATGPQDPALVSAIDKAMM